MIRGGTDDGVGQGTKESCLDLMRETREREREHERESESMRWPLREKP